MKTTFTATLAALACAIVLTACTSSPAQPSGPKYTTGEAGESPGMKQHTSSPQ